MTKKPDLFLLPALSLFVLISGISAPFALTLGIALALTLGNPHQKKTKAFVTPLLQLSIVGLGAGMNLLIVLKAGAQGFAYTIVGIGLTLILGDQILRRLLRSDSDTSFLITVGTAI